MYVFSIEWCTGVVHGCSIYSEQRLVYTIAPMINTQIQVSQEYDVAIKATNPVAVYINQSGNSNIGAYVYAVPRGTQCFTAVLQATKDNHAHDLATSMATVLAKRTKSPAYVSLSGYIPSGDYGPLASEVIGLIDGHSGPGHSGQGQNGQNNDSVAK